MSDSNSNYAVQRPMQTYEGLGHYQSRMVLADGSNPFYDATGASVYGVQSLSVPSYFRGVRLLSGTLATLPRKLYREKSDGEREPAGNHHAQRILSRFTSNVATPVVTFECWFSHAVAWGNGYLWIDRGQGDRPIALYNLAPDRMRPKRVNGRVVYQYRTPNGVEEIESRDILHLAGLGFDGLQGYDPVTLLADTLGMSRELIRFGKHYYENGTMLGGVVEVDGDANLTLEQRQSLRDEVEGNYSGAENAGRWMILHAAKARAMATPPETAKLIEAMGVGVHDIARILGVPPTLLYSLERATWGNASEMDRAFVKYDLAPWIAKAEAELSWKLLTIGERDRGLYVKLSNDGLLRGSRKERYEGYEKGLNNGWLTPNEVRRLEDMPQLEHGNTPRMPANMVALSTLDSPAEQAEKVEEDVESQTENDDEDNEAADDEPPRQLQQNSRVSALQPIVADAVARVRRKTEKMVANASKRDGTNWIVTGNMFAESQRSYAIDALSPVVEAMQAMGIDPIDAKAAALTYCNDLKRALYARQRDESPALPSLEINLNPETDDERQQRTDPRFIDDADK